MKLIAKVTSIFDRIIDFSGVITTAIVCFIMLIVCLDVVMRHFLGRPIIWQTEVTAHLIVYIAFLGAAWVLRSEGHVIIDVVTSRLNPSSRALLSSISSVIGVIISLVLIWYGAIVTVDNFQTGDYYPGQLLFPKYPVLAIIPVGGFFLLFQFIRNISKYLTALKTLDKTKQGPPNL